MVTWCGEYRFSTPFVSEGVWANRPEDRQTELRSPSFKGALRFWWRCLAWGQYGGALDIIRKRESELFGSADTGRGQIQVRVRKAAWKKEWKVGDRLPQHQAGLQYLAGLGLADRGTLTRPMLEQGAQFVADGLFRASGDSSVEIADALKIMGLLGGLGARTRRGFGSLVLSRLGIGHDEWVPPSTLDEFIERLKKIVGPRVSSASDGEPPYTAFSSDSRLVLVQGARGESATELLDRVGREFLRERSYGFNQGGSRKIAIRSDNQWEDAQCTNYGNDHDLMHDFLNPRKHTLPRSAPERFVFGLPHNYFFQSLKRTLHPKKPTATIEGDEAGRRASPLLLHAHELGDGPIVTGLFLPSRFLPRGQKIVIQDDNSRTHKVSVPSSPWGPVHDFLNRLHDDTGRGKSREGFVRTENVSFP